MNAEVTTRWRRLVEGSVNRRIFRAAVTVGVLTLIVKVAAMMKEMFVAAWFGIGDSLDAFLMAFLLPSYIINVIGGSFNAALIPIHIETRTREGAEAARRLFSSTVAFSCSLLVVATIVLAFLGPLVLPRLCLGFNAQKLLLTQRIFYLLLPVIVLSGVSANWEALLNSGERFAVAAFAPAAVSLATIAAVNLFGNGWGVYSLAFGLLAGVLGQLAVLGVALRQRGESLSLLWYGLDHNMRRVIRQYTPMIAGSILFCSSALVDQSMASMLSSGSVAALNYGFKLVSLATTIGSMALGTAVLPHFSKMVAQADWEGVHHTLNVYIRVILAATVPCTLMVIGCSTPIAAMLFERGSFSHADTLLVSQIQKMYFLQLPFFTLNIMFVRMISSLEANHILLWGTVIGFTLNIGLNFLFIHFMGVTGIALSTSFVYMGMCMFMAAMLYRILHRKEEENRCE